MESSPVVNGPEEAEQQEEVLVEEREARPSPEVGPVYQDDVYLGGGNVYELYRVVQQNFYMMFDRYLSFFSITSVKQHIEYCISISGVKSSWTFLYLGGG